MSNRAQPAPNEDASGVGTVARTRVSASEPTRGDSCLYGIALTGALALLAVTVALLLASGARADDGRIEIDQIVVSAGSGLPGDVPAFR